MTPNKSALSFIVLWIVALLVGGVLLLTRLQFSYDLSLFLPPPATQAQQVLIDRVGHGPGAKFLLVALPSDAQKQLRALQETLEATGQFKNIITQDSTALQDSVPEPLWSHRYLIKDVSFDQLSAVLQDRLGDIALVGASEFDKFIGADPFLVGIDAALDLAPVTDDTSWRTEDGAHLLIVESRASAFDIQAQRTAVNALTQSVKQTLDDKAQRVDISGVGAFSVELSNTIETEARWRSLIASLVVVIVLLIAYRRIKPVIIGVLPLASGAVLGLAVLALVFQNVHGITLAFGFTLMGVAIDYPLHLFSHSRGRSAASAINSIWPTLRLGLVSTVIAYAAIALSGAVGLAQLGVFTAVGLVVAAMVTRWILPSLLGTLPAAPQNGSSNKTFVSATINFRWWPIVTVCLASVVLFSTFWRGELWNNNLAALSPVPKAKLMRDAQMRRALGTASMRYVIAMQDSSLEPLLQKTERLSAALPELQNQGLIKGFRSVSQLLPSQSAQAKRRGDMPDNDVLVHALEQAIKNTPFSAMAFAPFAAAVAAQKSDELKLTDFADSPLQSFIDEHLYQSGDEWVSLMTLRVDEQFNASLVQKWLGEQGVQGHLLDFKQASEGLVQDYRQRTLLLLAIAFVLITVMLLWRLNWWRALWALSCVLTSLFTTASVVYLLTGALNLYHLMALLLVAGLGLDYALFLSRNPASANDNGMDSQASRHAVRACAITTVGAFTVLALSAVPALTAMGVTVAMGAGLSYLLARMSINSRS